MTRRHYRPPGMRLMSRSEPPLDPPDDDETGHTPTDVMWEYLNRRDESFLEDLTERVCMNLDTRRALLAAVAEARVKDAEKTVQLSSQLIDLIYTIALKLATERQEGGQFDEDMKIWRGDL